MADEPRKLTHAEVVDRLARIMRDRAYPEFTQAPPPLWATDAAEQIIRYHKPMLRDDVVREAVDDERARLWVALDQLPASVLDADALDAVRALLTTGATTCSPALERRLRAAFDEIPRWERALPDIVIPKLTEAMLHVGDEDAEIQPPDLGQQIR